MVLLFLFSYHLESSGCLSPKLCLEFLMALQLVTQDFWSLPLSSLSIRFVSVFLLPPLLTIPFYIEKVFDQIILTRQTSHPPHTLTVTIEIQIINPPILDGIGVLSFIPFITQIISVKKACITGKLRWYFCLLKLKKKFFMRFVFWDYKLQIRHDHTFNKGNKSDQ